MHRWSLTWFTADTSSWQRPPFGSRIERVRVHVVGRVQGRRVRTSAVRGSHWDESTQGVDGYSLYLLSVFGHDAYAWPDPNRPYLASVSPWELGWGGGLQR